MIVSLFQEVTPNQTISCFLRGKDLRNLCLTSRQIKQLVQQTLLNRMQQKTEQYFNALIDNYLYRKKQLAVLPRSNFNFGKEMVIKYKELEHKVVKVQLKDLPKGLLTLPWQATTLEIESLNLLQNRTFKFNDIYISINRSLIDPSLNHQFVLLHDEDNSKEILQQIAESNEFTGDFTNMQDLLHRQKLILQKIDKNQQKVTQKVQQQEPTIQSLAHLNKYAIILCHGGYFCLGIYDKERCTYHKSDHKYVVRAKQGQRQLAKDSNSGTQIKSMGSQIRRDQEKKHQANVSNILTDALPLLEECSIVFLQAPGINSQMLIQEEEPLFKIKDKIRSLCLTAKKANYTEVERIQKNITNVFLIQSQSLFF